MKPKNTTKENTIIICYNLFNENKEFKYNCHSQIYGNIKELNTLCSKLCNQLNNARKYNQAWFECYFIDKKGKTVSKTLLKTIEKGMYPEELMRIIINNKHK